LIQKEKIMKTAVYIFLLGVVYYLACWEENIEDQTSLKIAGLGNYSQQDLEFVAKVIDEFANIKTTNVTSVSTNDKTVYRYKDGKLVLDCAELHDELPFNSFTKRLILVTSEKLSNGDKKIGGVAFNFDKVAVVSSASSRASFKITIIHEYCHLLKLKHCEDEKCLMNESPHTNNAVDLCPTCRKKINYTKVGI
jgi:hypothetical protein